jgi:hypothetical protein
VSMHILLICVVVLNIMRPAPLLGFSSIGCIVFLLFFRL